jgi:glycolate oxidase FAD binding subunit
MESQTSNGHMAESGLQLEQVERPRSSQEVSDFLRSATENGTPVVPIGGRCSLGTGCIVECPISGLDLTGIAGIVSYEPADLTISVKAGTRVSNVQDALRLHGQQLPIDVPFPATATIGGLVATGFAGPRRLRSGSLRDLLIGCEYVRGDGLVAKAGGMVVKNVSGFEIPRLLHGSWGSLAVLSSVNLKVTPVPRHEATWRYPSDGIGEGVRSVQALLAQFPHIDAATTISDAAGTWNQVRFLGRKGSVDESIASCKAAVGESGGELLEGDISQKFWQETIEDSAENRGQLVVAIGCRSSEVLEAATDLQAALAHTSSLRLVVSPGTGSIRVVDSAEFWEPSAVEHLLASARQGGRRAIVESASDIVRQSVPVWGPAPEGIEVMRAIKREFDPAGILNRGRLFV